MATAVPIAVAHATHLLYVSFAAFLITFPLGSVYLTGLFPT